MSRDQEPGIGHNSQAEKAENSASDIAGDELRSFIERLERLAEEKASLAGDMKDVMAEAKGRGFDTRVIRKILVLRRRDHSDVLEENAIMELYCQALGLDFML